MINEDEVIVHIATHPWDTIESYYDIENMLSQQESGSNTSISQQKKVCLNLKTKSVPIEDWQNLTEVTIDFPVINYEYVGYKKRYTYG